MGSLAEFVLGRDACGKKTEQAEQQRKRLGGRWAACRRDFSLRGFRGTGPRERSPLPWERKCDLAVVQKSGQLCIQACSKLELSLTISKNGISSHESGTKRFAHLCSWKAGPEYLVTASNHYRIVRVWLFFRPKMRQFKEALTGPLLYQLKVTVWTRSFENSQTFFHSSSTT